ncbi:uncharacterized protein LOC114265957 [Camellia sinensis]|uniref:uncharacterized protein LOC114265957 n=1 Tax=Camellia sinensis TaxID=4442 RepID=UPI0010360314|nr:uncharacterized protein LOC114265957 [Camellia sinensis]
MRWHNEKRVDDDILRPPADGKAWKDFDKQHPTFSDDSRNVRLGLATDGFHPFGNMSTSYSMWPVILMPYNLPPWKCMKEPYCMMSLLIPGRSAPGRDIDVYLQPLIEELRNLWEHGVQTYDVSNGQIFRMHAAVMWTINDFPAYGNMSGWSTKGYLACPNCNNNVSSQGLRSKIGYMGARRHLPENHTWRTSKLFNGQTEHRSKPLELSGDQVLEQIDSGTYKPYGKHPQNRKRQRNEHQNLNWSKRSIMFDLPYWKTLKLRHNLDVMHIEKSICDNVVGTLLSVDRKNKDTDKARLDLEDMKIPNISNCVNAQAGKLSGLKSHDSHVLIQRLLPIGMRGYLNKEIGTTLFELGNFFKQLCSKTLRRSDLHKLDEQIVLILCKLEMLFPPAFFDVMVHLAIHLPREAMLGGPVQYRWMYPIESVTLTSACKIRLLGRLKGFVVNKAHPEGFIAEAYISKECTTFCSMYLDGVETLFNRPERNYDMGDRGCTSF